jgi:hypothetical protein
VSGELHASPKWGTVTLPGSYSFHGELANCSGSSVVAPAATIAAGEPVTIAGRAYEAPPAATGTTSCLFTTQTTGKALIRWSDGGITVLSFTTIGQGLVTTLAGQVSPFIDLMRVERVNGKPVVDRINTTRFTGYSPNAAVAFTPAGSQTCTDGGASDLTFAGVLNLTLAS